MRETTSNNLQKSSPLPSLKTITRGLQVFIIFSLLGAVLAFWWKKPMGFEALLQQLKWSYMIILIPLVVVDYLIGGMRFRLFFNGKFLTKISLWDCMRSNWANTFMGTVTPLQTGGGPAQVYILWRCGAKISEGALVSLINYFTTLIFFLTASIISLLFLPPHFLGKNLALVLKIGYIALVILILFVLFVLFFPRAILIGLRGFFQFIPIRRDRFFQIRDRMSNTIESGTKRFQKALKEILLSRKGTLGIVTGLTISLYLNKFLIGYFIACMLWEEVPFATFIALQIIQIVLIYFAPTPGSSGVAELSSTWLIAHILPSGLTLIYTVMWRFFTTILGAIIGGFVLLFDMRYLSKEELKKN